MNRSSSPQSKLKKPEKVGAVMTEKRVELLERSLEKAWDKIDTLSELVIELKILNKTQKEMLDSFEKKVSAHMLTDETALETLNVKIDALTRYKWIALGAIMGLVAVTDKDVVGLVAKIVVGG